MRSVCSCVRACRVHAFAPAYGAETAARNILLSVYLAILVVSVALLFKPVAAMVAALLSVQIIYKLSTPFTVGSWENPVVQSNLAISAVHLVTLFLIWRDLAKPQ